LLVNGVLSEANLKKSVKALHTSVVATNKGSLINNILGTPPPEVDPSERTLGRRDRCTLTQLRLEYSNSLNSYKERIGTNPDDLCPHCNVKSHKVQHIFDCPFTPTNLTIHDLWKRPRETTDFLWTLFSFSHLPPNPPLHRPLPEPSPTALRAPD
jgi:hypothetical protein